MPSDQAELARLAAANKILKLVNDASRNHHQAITTNDCLTVVDAIAEYNRLLHDEQ